MQTISPSCFSKILAQLNYCRNIDPNPSSSINLDSMCKLLGTLLCFQAVLVTKQLIFLWSLLNRCILGRVCYVLHLLVFNLIPWRKSSLAPFFLSTRSASDSSRDAVCSREGLYAEGLWTERMKDRTMKFKDPLLSPSVLHH